jgi:hypothetical protein
VDGNLQLGTSWALRCKLELKGGDGFRLFVRVIYNRIHVRKNIIAIS